MKRLSKIGFALAIFSASAWLITAQNNEGQSQDQQGQSGPGVPGSEGPPNGPRRGPGHRPPPPPLIAALDANHDGVIDENEIANAAAALKALDKNGDGKLTPDEFAPPRPPHGGPGGHHGPPPPDGEGAPAVPGAQPGN
ncbi:MAG TPA: hypothetical protein VLT36_22255 [Candidatus Dormibacteraeota bacterium]|nr:hypothetical protein [Candidatus Dormibacteraeota bacterium]